MERPAAGDQRAPAYDGTGELGLLDSTSRFTSEGEWIVDVDGYDDRNRPTGRTWTVPAGVTGLADDYTVAYGYDSADHQTSVTYPAVGGLALEEVTTVYNSLGQPETMAGDEDYVTTAIHDDRGRPLLFAFGSAGSPSLGKTWTYNTNQELSATSAAATGGAPVQDRSITYDKFGNVTQRDSSLTTLLGTATTRECNGYDQRQRLTSAYTTTTATTCASGANQGTGPAPYDHTYTYTHDGNIDARTEDTTNIDYTYPAPGPTSTRPHAPTDVGGDTYTWDANGNLDTRTISGQTEDLTWDTERRLATIDTPTGDSTFTYDADGTRLLRQTPTGTTLYIEDHEVTAPASGPITAVRTYDFDGMPVAVRDGGGVSYLVTDNQGSVEATVPTGATTADVARTYLPYGKRRSGPQLDTDHAWIGQIEDDATGLSYLNPRYYDPTIGVFISADPVYDPSRPKTQNPYNYGASNPTTLSDPSGLDPPCFHPGVSCSTETKQAQVDALQDLSRNLAEPGSRPVCWCPMLFEGAQDVLSLYNQGFTLERILDLAGWDQYEITREAISDQLAGEELLYDALMKYARDQWEEKCGGFGYHGRECLSKWWNDWGDEVKLAGAVVVAGTCVVATGSTGTAICLHGGRILLAANVTESSVKNGIWPGGDAPKWGAFVRDVGLEVGANRLGGRLKIFASKDAVDLDYVARAIGESPGLTKEFIDYIQS